MDLSFGSDYQWWLTDPLALVRRSAGTRPRKQTFDGVFLRWHFRRAAADARAPSSRQKMDLVWWLDRGRHRIAEHSMAIAASLAHVRVAQQHRSQQQKRRPKPGTIHLAADYFHEPRNTSAMALRVNLVVQFGRWQALHGAWNHIPGPARRVHHLAWQKLLPRARVSDALCNGRGSRGARFC